MSEGSGELEHSEPVPLQVCVSGAFVAYRHRRHELSSFTEFYHRAAKLAFQPMRWWVRRSLYDEYMGQQIYFIENYICKMSEFFDLFLEDLVKCICQRKRDFLPEREYQKAKVRLENSGVLAVDDEELLHDASSWFCRRSKELIAEHFLVSVGFDFSTKLPLWPRVLLASKIRNQIVHNASVADDAFLRNFDIHNLPFKLGPDAHLVFSEKFILKLAEDIDACVKQIDLEIENYVQLQRINRYGHFWLPRSVWSRPSNNVEAT